LLSTRICLEEARGVRVGGSRRLPITLGEWCSGVWEREEASLGVSGGLFAFRAIDDWRVLASTGGRWGS